MHECAFSRSGGVPVTGLKDAVAVLPAACTRSIFLELRELQHTANLEKCLYKP